MEQNDAGKKVNFENLSKEELMKKCTQLLQLAQKAKHAKSILQEENSKLKEELNSSNSNKSNPVLEELIDNLTQQKLSLVTKNQELKTQNECLLKKILTFETELKEYEEKLNISDNENTSYKRQIFRLTNENEQLISELDVIEKSKSEENEKTKTELQLMLSVSLEEIQKLKNENNQMINKIENLQLNLGEKDKNIIVISQELTSTKNKFAEDVKELVILKNIHESSEQKVDALNDRLKNIESNNLELKECNLKFKQKLNVYHSKIVKFAGIAKELRKNKDEVLDLFKTYINQVKDWKEQLNEGEKIIVKYLSNIELENQQLRKKLEEHNGNKLENEIKIVHDKYKSENICLKKSLEDANENIKKLSTEIDELRQNNMDNKLLDDKEKIVNDLKEIKIKHNEEKATLFRQLHEMQNNKEVQENDNLQLQKQLIETNKTIQELEQQINCKQCTESDIENIQNKFDKERAVDLNKLSELQNSKEKLENEKLLLEQEIKQNVETIGRANKEIENLRNRETDTNTLLYEKQKLENELKEIQIKLKKEKDDLQNLKDSLGNEKLHFEQELTQFSGWIRKANEEIENLKHKQTNSNKLLEGNKKLESDFKEIQTKFNEEKIAFLDKLGNLKNSKDILENKKLLLEQELKQSLERLKVANEEIEELKEKSESEFNKIQLKYEEEQLVLCNKLREKEMTSITMFEELQNYRNETLKLQENEKLNIEKLTDINKVLKEQQNEIKLLRNENTTISKIKEDLLEELDKLNLEKKSFKEKSEKFNSTTQQKLQECEKTVSELQNQVRSLEELEMRSTEEIKSLADENKLLLSENEKLQDKLQNLEYSLSNSTPSKEVMGVEEYDEQIATLKRENTELLAEMNEMNQAIKERGENISKLEAHCEEILKKLQIYETQANKNIDNLTEKEKIIENLTNEIQELKNNNESSSNSEITALQSEIETLKEKINSNMEFNYPDNDTMSTSTISRTEDTNRLKDLEGSWEEKYGKLRNLAVKLKGKVRELTQTVTQQQVENEEAQKKLSVNIKTIQNLQNQCDKLEDDLEKSKEECDQLQNRLATAAMEISRDKQSLADKEESLSKQMVELENYKREKQTMDNWKKQVGAKIQTLRKELDANNVLKKEFEAQVFNLTSNLEVKEQALKNEIEHHKHTKNLLEQSNNERKKNSVLSLEMQDYERSAKESTKKLEKLNEEITRLNNHAESQKSTINALREQAKLLEERLATEEQSLNSATSEIDNYKKQISSLNDDVGQKVEKIQSLTRLLETSRSETEELSTELSKLIAEHQKNNGNLKAERDRLSNENLSLQQSLREHQDNLKLSRDELRVVQSEYDGYKVRAQSVLRQNQNRDVGLEEKLSEKVAALAARNSSLTDQIDASKKKMDCLENENGKLSEELKDHKNKIRELEEDLEEVRAQFADLSVKYEKTVADNVETLRNHKIHADTLSQCYRQQLADQETRHNREILELQNRLDKAPTPTETSPVLPNMPRGEGEGSESNDSNVSTSIHPVPLERLLGSDSDQEVNRIKKKLQEHESKVTHLTALLSDTEQDLVKHIQMNKLLKEEIRRQQRSEEREKHAENLEYLKNVVFKFVTLNNADERSRLVPVMNTILKLSPEETKHLNSVAKGEQSLKGWSSYLPTWSSPNKPQ